MMHATICDRCWFGREGVEKIESFFDNVEEYLQKAQAGENPYKLEIDPNWAEFMYQSSRMSCKKFFTLLIAIIPSFSKFLNMSSTKLMIQGCYLENSPKVPLKYSECIRYNEESPYVTLNTSQMKGDNDNVLSQILVLMPHVYFFLFILGWFISNIFTVFLKAARINFTTGDKRWNTCGHYFIFIITILLTFVCGIFIFGLREGFLHSYSIPYNSTTNIIFTFHQKDLDSFMNFVSSMLIYSCLLTVMINYIREPMLFFTGFRNYLKQASYVKYNTAIVHYRIKNNSMTTRFVGRYYRECANYDRHTVVLAMVTQLLDLDLLEVEGSDELSKKR